MIGVQVTIEVEETLAKDLAEFRQMAAKAAVRATETILTAVEETSFIGVYTSKGSPPQPTNSKYVRTFKLQGGSRRQVTHTQFPVKGLWKVSGVKYAPRVLGLKADQALIHKGRWRPLETYVVSVQEKAPSIVENELRKIKV